MIRGGATFTKLAVAMGTIGLASAPWSTWAEAPGTTAIAQILSDPASFNLEIVTLGGTIREIRTIALETDCGTGTGQVYFLRDETGELAIRDVGTCSEGSYIPVLASDISRGDRVLVRAAIAVHPDVSDELSPLDATLVRIERVSD